MNNDKFLKFCEKVMTGFGTITDSSVKFEFERVYETQIDTTELAKLLALLEKNSLLDEKFSVNRQKGFYQTMYKKINESK
jgi:hypothetical protein